MSVATDRSSPLLDRLAGLPEAALRTGADVGAGHAADMSTTKGSQPHILVRPGTTEEVAIALAACNDLRQPIVVQGGLTGLAGGASPFAGEVALSLERMRGIGPVDPSTASILVEAGVPLAALQEAAGAEGFRFPVDLGARGSATIGGMIATNAGGIRAMRHGMMRAHVLGLEVVLADGSVLSRLGALVKDNSGFDLKQLFCGTEGTLGVVTRARLSLQPVPPVTALALVRMPSLSAAQDMLGRLRKRLGDRLSAFEYIEHRVYAAVDTLGRVRMPLATGDGDYGLIEIEGIGAHDVDAFEALLGEGLEAGLLTDVVLARSGREQAEFWALRDGCSEMIFTLSDTYGFDIAIEPGRLRAFLTGTEAEIARCDPEARLWLFGHLGDGNIHFIVTTLHLEAVSEIVYAALARTGGALSAEHGLGREKAAMLPLVRSAAEIATMRRLKAALDPNSILNRGRVLPPSKS